MRHLRRAGSHLNKDISGFSEEIMILIGRVEDLSEKVKEVRDFKTRQTELNEIKDG